MGGAMASGAGQIEKGMNGSASADRRPTALNDAK
jgi:hypothetical protein